MMGEATDKAAQAAKGGKAAGSKAQRTAGAQAPQQAPERAASTARPYIVLREVDPTTIDATTFGADAKVYVELGSATTKTPKEARRTVAKQALSEDELRTEAGVPLRAVARGAFEAGTGVARLKVEPTWDD